MEYLSRLMNRRYTDSPVFRKILQSIWHQINNGQEIYVIGKVLDDKTVKGGTGWGAEFAKLCNKPLKSSIRNAASGLPGTKAVGLNGKRVTNRSSSIFISRHRHTLSRGERTQGR